MSLKLKLKTGAIALATVMLLSGTVSSAMAAEKEKDKADNKIKVEVNYWQPALDSKVKVSSNGIGTEINLSDDLGVADKNFTDFRIIFGHKARTRVAYTDFDYSGNTNISGAIDYNGQHYSAGTDVNSKMDIKYYRLGFLNRIAGNDKTNIDFIVELKGFQFDTALKSSYNDSSKKFTGVVPTIGFGFTRKIGSKLTMGGEFTGLPAGGYGHIYDLETRLNYDFSPNTSLAVGYRVFELKAKNDDDYAQVKLKGPYFNLSAKF